MSKAVIYVVIVAALLSLSCTQERTSEVTPRALVNGLENELERLDRACRLEMWKRFVHGGIDSLEYYRMLRGDLFMNDSLWSEIKTSRLSVDDERLARKLDLLYWRFLLERIERQPSLRRLTDSLRAILDSDSRRAGYRINEGIFEAMAGAVRYRNQAARESGFNSYYTLHMQALALETAWADDLLAALERRLIGQQFAPTAFPDSLMAADRQLAAVKSIFRNIGFDLARLPIYPAAVEKTSMVPAARTLVIHCPDDVRILHDLQDGSGSFKALFEAVGKAVYFTQTAEDDYLFVAPTPDFWWLVGSTIFGGLIDDSSVSGAFTLVSGPIGRDLTAMESETIRSKFVMAAFEKIIYTEPYGGFRDKYDKISGAIGRPAESGERLSRSEMYHLVFDPLYYLDHLMAEAMAAQLLAFYQRQFGPDFEPGDPAAFLAADVFPSNNRYDRGQVLLTVTGENFTPDYFIARLPVSSPSPE